MFAIYDAGGRSFRDSLENLRKVKRKPPASHITPAYNYEEMGNTPHPGSYSASAQACQVYRERLPAKDRERVIHAHQIMSSPVEFISGSEGIIFAWKRFQMLSHHQLPVLNSKRQIVGMLSERNLLQYLIIENGEITSQRDKSVVEVMSQPIIASDPVTDIRRIATVMMEYGQSAVPITSENDQLVGLVSRSDVLRAITMDPPLSLWT